MRDTYNVILIEQFARRFDGFSIGSNDLTQLTLGVDRDSEIVAFDYDERVPFKQAVAWATTAASGDSFLVRRNVHIAISLCIVIAIGPDRRSSRQGH